MTFSYQDYKIKISKSVLEQIYQYRQTGSLSSESGGVLIGRQIISTGNLIIDLCTVPMPLDVCKRTRYLRKDTASQGYARSARVDVILIMLPEIFARTI